MSASLVGSEMCIRDRVVAAGAARPAAGPVGGHLSRGWGGMAAAEAIQTAVSYTHLTLPTICSV
eukprot:3444592-Alexandrium_andersonii.AAC.1